jgi:hypothetical protein
MALMKNYLKIALQEQKSEAQPIYSSKSKKFPIPVSGCISTHKEWKYNIRAAQSYGDKPYMEDSVDTHFIPMWDNPSDIKQLSNLLYSSIYLLGDLFFFYDTGSTFVCAMHYKDNCLIGNLGDSRALLIRKKNDAYKTLRLNQAHRRGNLYEKIRMEKESTNWGNKNLEYTYVYRGLGGFDYCPLICYEPEITYFRLPKNEKNTILLCSDGVSDALNEAEINYMFTNFESVTPDVINNYAYNSFKLQNKEADNISSLLYNPQISNSEITLACIADGVGDQTVAELSTKLLPKLVHPNVLPTPEKFISWREIYNNSKSEISTNDILDMKDYAKKLVQQCINANGSISELLDTWLEKKKQYYNSNPL